MKEGGKTEEAGRGEGKQWQSVKNSNRCFRHQQAQTNQRLPGFQTAEVSDTEEILDLKLVRH